MNLLLFLILLTLLINSFGGPMNWKQVCYIVILVVAILATFTPVFVVR